MCVVSDIEILLTHVVRKSYLLINFDTDDDQLTAVQSRCASFRIPPHPDHPDHSAFIALSVLYAEPRSPRPSSAPACTTGVHRARERRDRRAAERRGIMGTKQKKTAVDANGDGRGGDRLETQ